MIRASALILALAVLPKADQAVRFTTYDVFVDAGAKRLGAYQIEIICNSAQSTIVGVESGVAPFDESAPYYDPAALRKGRIILAAFTTQKVPPAGRIRVARVHFQETGLGEYSSKLILAASPEADRIRATATLVRAGEEK